MIRADLTLLADPTADLAERVAAPFRRSAETSRTSAKAPETQAFPPPAAVPSWARASGRATAIRCSSPGPPSLCSTGICAAIRPPPARSASASPCFGAAASAQILRLNADAAALRDLRFAVGEAWGERRGCYGCGAAPRPAVVLDPERLSHRGGRPRPGRGPEWPRIRLKACAGEDDPVAAAAKAAAFTFSIFPDTPAADAEILSLWTFDMVIAIRLRWPRPLPLIARKILDAV